MQEKKVFKLVLRLYYGPAGMSLRLTCPSKFCHALDEVHTTSFTLLMKYTPRPLRFYKVLSAFRSGHALTACLLRSHCTVGTQLWDGRSQKALKYFLSIPGLYFYNEDHLSFMRRWYYINAIIPTSLMSPYCVLIGSGPCHDFF